MRRQPPGPAATSVSASSLRTSLKMYLHIFHVLNQIFFFLCIKCVFCIFLEHLVFSPGTFKTTISCLFVCDLWAEGFCFGQKHLNHSNITAFSANNSWVLGSFFSFCCWSFGTFCILKCLKSFYSLIRIISMAAGNYQNMYLTDKMHEWLFNQKKYGIIENIPLNFKFQRYGQVSKFN